MTTITQRDLVARHERLKGEISHFQQKRAQLVQQRTQELSEAHEDINGSFSTTSLRRIDGMHPFSHSHDPEKEAAMNEVLDMVEASDEYQHLTTEISNLEEELDEVWSLAADVIVDNDLTKKANIGRIWAAFGEEIPNRRVAEAVGSHKQYPGRLVFDSETETVDYKDHVKKRKENQVRPDQRQEILERDDYACVRCGATTTQHDLRIHHIDPVDNEGPATRVNLATLCHPCHGTVHDARGAGAVIYNTSDGFWAWVRNGSRGFDPHQSDLTDF
jgi:hypothetical protein